MRKFGLTLVGTNSTQCPQTRRKYLLKNLARNLGVGRRGYRHAVEEAPLMPKTLHHLKRLFKSIGSYPLRQFLRTFSSPDVYELNVRLKSLVSDGNLEAARKLFDEMPKRDSVTWNTMIAAYWKQRNSEESKRLFDSMPTASIVSWNCMISGCIESGMLEEALGYFHDMPERSIASWNAVISGLVKFGRFDEAERLFNEMPKRNVISYTAMVDGFLQKQDIERARRLFDRIPRKNQVTWAVMISGYVENGRLDEALRLFERMPEKNAVAYTVVLTGYCKEGRVECARRIFEEIKDKDIASWNAMIAGYAHNGHGEEALKLLRNMVILGEQPDHTSLLGAFAACSILTSLQVGKQTHALAIKSGAESNTSLCNAIMTMYSKCGSILDSEKVFQHLQCKKLVSWNAIIAAYAQHGYHAKTLAFFRSMSEHGLKPDGITFLSVLSACGHAGKVEESLSLFDSMVNGYLVSPHADHFSCLVNALCRGGKLEEAYNVITMMPFEPDRTIWGALLGACRVHANVELGEVAASKLVELDPQNSGVYIMMSNIYAAAGMWAEVTRVRMLMRERGVQKQQGHSWIEIRDSVHLFLGGDMSHPCIDEIHLELHRISLHMQIREDGIGAWNKQDFS